MGKRAQKKAPGPMRALHWTDHANFTKQGSINSSEIDVKMLRWIAEITADGSEVRSVAGRAVRLGGGTYRNPDGRDDLIEQRSRDLQGIIGHFRGYDMDEYLGRS